MQWHTGVQQGRPSCADGKRCRAKIVYRLDDEGVAGQDLVQRVEEAHAVARARLVRALGPEQAHSAARGAVAPAGRARGVGAAVRIHRLGEMLRDEVERVLHCAAPRVFALPGAEVSRHLVPGYT